MILLNLLFPVTRENKGWICGLALKKRQSGEFAGNN